MPLLNGEPFERHRLDSGIHPDSNVYFCEATTEAFTNFDDYFERAVLCSSMAWTCSWTGKSELTFLEAVASEATAHSSLSCISLGLQKALLILTKTIETTKFNDICHFLWSYTSCRFFVGEEVYVMHHNEKKAAKIVKVIPPNHTVWDTLSNVCYGMDPSGYRYDVMSTDNSKKPFRMVCCVERISRPTGNLTKDRIKLFMKQHVNAYKRLTITELKESSIEALELDSLEWEDVFAGPLPQLDPEDGSLPTRVRKKSRSSATSAEKDKSSRKKESSEQSLEKKKPGPKPLDPEEKKRKLEEQRKKQNEKKRLEREKAREEKQRHAMLHAEWSRKRDDLECDDLKPLLSGVPVSCSIPCHLFGDALLIMEFFHNFEEFFDLKEIFPHGFTFDLLLRVLCEKSIKSPVSDLIRITLATIFCCLEEEEAEDKKDEKKDNETAVENQEVDEDDVAGDDLRSAMNQALRIQNVLKRIHGPKNSTMEVTPMTVSEILRLHLLTSGAPRSRNIYRGWFCSREDPVLMLRIERPDIIDKLTTCSVYELETEERIAILNAIICQVMTLPAFREILETTVDKIVVIRKEIRSAQADFSRWERENAVKKPRKDGDAEEPNEMTPEELESAISAFNAEREKKAVALEKILSECRQKIRKLEAQYSVKSLGRDRAYRRYWVFNSIPGLFIEQDDAFTGPCVQQPDVMNGLQSPSSLSPTNNKENEFGEKTKRSPSGQSSPNVSSLLTCTGSPATCLIHTNKPVTKYKWRFCANSVNVQELIDSLNPRGFRESDLKSVLERDIKFFENSISECPVSKLNTDIPCESRRENSRLVYYKPSMSGLSHVDKEPDCALKLMFVDHILSLEEQLFLSGLSFRVNSAMTRDEWKSFTLSVDISDTDFVNHMTEALRKVSSVVPTNNIRGDWSTQKWNESLDETSSISRLHFLLSVFESRIDFPKNVHAFCRVCRRKKDAESMLLCDSCNRGFHTFCLKPPLESVPKGEWFCPQCKPDATKVPKSPRKPLKDVVDEDDDDEDEICTIDSSSRTPSPSQNVTEDEETEDESTEAEGDLCAICASADDDPDVECTRCNRKFHYSCHVPKVSTNSKNWICSTCTSASKNKRKAAQTAPTVEDEISSARPKRTRVALNTAASEQTTGSADRKVRTSARSTRHADDDGYNYVLCYKMLDKLKRHPSSWPFLKRPNGKDVPNYYDKVKTHMDLGILTQNLNTGVYTSNGDFVRDAYLMFGNCKSYWDKGTDQHEAGIELEELFRTLVKEHMPQEASSFRIHRMRDV